MSELVHFWLLHILVWILVHYNLSTISKALIRAVKVLTVWMTPTYTRFTYYRPIQTSIQNMTKIQKISLLSRSNCIIIMLFTICFQDSKNQREISLRDSLQKFITLHKSKSVYLWGWCRMLVEIDLLPWGWPHAVSSMPKNLKKVQIYPNPVITLLEVNSLTLHNLHYNVLALCKAARPAKKRENQNFGAVMRLFVSYLFVRT